MNPLDVSCEKLIPETASATEDIIELKAQLGKMQMQIDILEETINA